MTTATNPASTMPGPGNGQKQLIPDEPLISEMRRIRLSDIPEGETFASRLPSPSMRESVERFGILTPILVCPKTVDRENRYRVGADGAYRLLAGRRRVIAARDAGIMMINAVVFPAGTTPAEAVSIIENEQRSENPLVELRQIEEVIRLGGTLADICDATGMDKRRAEARMRLANLTPKLRGLLIENKMAIGVAEDAARLTPEEQGVLYDAAQKNGGRIRGKDVSAARKVKAENAAASLPSSMFADASGGDSDRNGAGKIIDDGNDENRPVSVAKGLLPAGLTVALFGGLHSMVGTGTRPGEFPTLTTTEEALQAGQSLRAYLLRLESFDDLYGSEILVNALDNFIAGKDDDDARELFSPHGTGPAAEKSAPSGVSSDPEKAIKPDSAKRAERRRKERERRAAEGDGVTPRELQEDAGREAYLVRQEGGDDIGRSDESADPLGGYEQ